MTNFCCFCLKKKLKKKKSEKKLRILIFGTLLAYNIDATRAAKWPAGCWWTEWECFWDCFFDLHDNLYAWAAYEDLLVSWWLCKACGEAIVGLELALFWVFLFQKITELAHSTDIKRRLPGENVTSRTSLFWPSKSFLFASAMRSQRRNVALQDNLTKCDASLECETQETNWLWPARRANCGSNECCTLLSFQTSTVLSFDAGLWPTNVARGCCASFKPVVFVLFWWKWPTVL